MAYNLGEIQPGAYVIKATSSGAITKGYFVEIEPKTAGPKVALYDGAKPAGVIGVALDAAASGDVIRVCIDGMVGVQCDATTGVDAFDFVSSTADGTVEVADLEADYVLGIALDIGAAGGVALIKLNQITGILGAAVGGGSP